MDSGHRNESFTHISEIASRDAPTTTNEKGGSQSHIPTRFDLVDGKAMFAMAAVLHEGAEKYGIDNWRLIPIKDHLNHLIMHAYAYLAGDRTDEHLSHIMCRAMFAQGIEFQEADEEPVNTSSYIHDRPGANCTNSAVVDFGEGPVRILCTQTGKHEEHICEVRWALD